MATTKAKGDLAELMVAADLVRKGYKIAIPFGEDWDFDLIVCRGERLERVQVKHATSDGVVIYVSCRSSSLTHGKVKRIKRYTASMIDWIAVYDRTTDRCFYVPAAELGDGRDMISLRLMPTRNNQRAKVRYAEDYVTLDAPPQQAMEPAGFEPATSSVQATRSPN